MQANLFDDDSSAVKHSLVDAELVEYQQIFSESEAERLLQTLQSEIPWRQEQLRIAGKLRDIPRLQCWMGDKSSRYGYSGVRLSPCPWNPTVSQIHDRVSELCDHRFNSVLLNFYRNGNDSVAWHADDESELGEKPIIASVSLGAERVFELKRKNKVPTKKYEIILRHASLLVMGETMQRHWLHQLPKVKDLNEPRINLTFRNIVST